MVLVVPVVRVELTLASAVMAVLVVLVVPVALAVTVARVWCPWRAPEMPVVTAAIPVPVALVV